MAFELEYLGLGSLEQLFILTKINQFLNGNEVFYIARGIALALEYLHSMQIIHADVKLANILLSSSLQPKVADFGLARYAPNGHLSNASAFSFTQSHMIAAPETLRKPKNQRVITNKVDVWSFGCVLYTLVTGCLPLNLTKEWQFLDEEKAGKAVLELLNNKDERLLENRQLLRYVENQAAIVEVEKYF